MYSADKYKIATVLLLDGLIILHYPSILGCTSESVDLALLLRN